MDAATFAASRADLPDGGRWTELIAGEPVMFAPPEPLHGTFVLNLSKALARAAADAAVGAGAVFETGLRTASDPDTVRFPAALLFARGVFGQMDREIADDTPAVAVEVPGTPDRRRQVGRRVEEYHAAGVSDVWIANLTERSVTVAAPHAAPVTLSGSDRLATALLPAFGPAVEDLFAEPDWWK